ncbi:hypothetical protein ABZ281_23300 [Streptomyces sp. NPDC006265]|uniref:hypothetical protein n=1 Tax=Streptomyces sp. NPDC006265 TaxID=3156740 RepID=UPI0033B612F5
MERRQVLLDVLTDIGPSIVRVWSTTDLDGALLWFETFEGTGCLCTTAVSVRLVGVRFQ